MVKSGSFLKKSDSERARILGSYPSIQGSSSKRASCWVYAKTVSDAEEVPSKSISQNDKGFVGKENAPSSWQVSPVIGKRSKSRSLLDALQQHSAKRSCLGSRHFELS